MIEGGKRPEQEPRDILNFGHTGTGMEALAAQSRQRFDAIVQHSRQQWQEMVGKAERFWLEANRGYVHMFPETPRQPEESAAKAEPDATPHAQAQGVVYEQPHSEDIVSRISRIRQEFRDGLYSLLDTK